ncbi:MAG: DUF456 domain-containing protein [Nostocoides sp.]
MSTDLWVPALFIGVGILGIVVPVIPGLLVALVGVLIWAIDTGSTFGWVILGICAVLYAAGLTVQFLVPGRRLKQQGVGTGTLLIALLIAIVGFFLVPVVGGPLGFVLGIYLLERLRSRDGAVAWDRTKHALRAVLTSMGIELATGLLIAVTWLVGAVVTWRSSH